MEGNKTRIQVEDIIRIRIACSVCDAFRDETISSLVGLQISACSKGHRWEFGEEEINNHNTAVMKLVYALNVMQQQMASGKQAYTCALEITNSK